MEKTQRNFIRKLLALFVTMTMLASMLSVGITVSAAPMSPTLTHDPVTADNWQALFPSNSTENAGGVWTDKSVVSGDDDTLDAIRGQKAEPGEFLVGLSTIGSALDLHEGNATPTDTVFVLDSSSSMNGLPRTELNTAVNEAIDKLMSLHPKNRVAVVYYSGAATNHINHLNNQPIAVQSPMPTTTTIAMPIILNIFFTIFKYDTPHFTLYLKYF